MPPSKYPRLDSNETRPNFSLSHSSARRGATRYQTLQAHTSTSRKRARDEESGDRLGIESNTTVISAQSTKRRKNRLAATSGRHDVVDLTGDEPEQPGPSTPKKKRKQPSKSPKSTKSTEERRRRVFRKHAPQTFLVKLDRARTQRFAKKMRPLLLSHGF